MEKVTVYLSSVLVKRVILRSWELWVVPGGWSVHVGSVATT